MDIQKHNITITKPVHDQLTAFAARVKRMAPDARVILFGSQAAGTATANSDIDVCVVAKQFDRDYHAGTVSLLTIAHEFPLPMDVIPYTQEDLNNKYDPLAKEIRTRGIMVP